jgi:AcrR family transcriptional regulator
LSGKSDSRVQNTRRSLHEALIGLIREKDYDDVVVREILNRAHVSRSAFYTHFDGKDELLVSGIENLVARSDRQDSLTSFSLPIFEHHDEHRRTGKMNARTRRLLHQRLRALIARRIRHEAQHSASRCHDGASVPPDLLAQLIASTFVIVLDWWLDTKSPLSPTGVNDLFCSLVGPALPRAAHV